EVLVGTRWVAPWRRGRWRRGLGLHPYVHREVAVGGPGHFEGQVVHFVAAALVEADRPWGGLELLGTTMGGRAVSPEGASAQAVLGSGTSHSRRPKGREQGVSRPVLGGSVARRGRCDGRQRDADPRHGGRCRRGAADRR